MSSGDPNSSSCLIEELRDATRSIHQGLHRHPLLCSMLQNPSHGTYASVLQGFLAFYYPIEPVIIRATKKLGAPTLYRRPDCTSWLLSDLANLRSRVQTTLNLCPPQFESVGRLAGCLYVVKGSARGARVIAGRITKKLDIRQSCRFLTSNGRPDDASAWAAFGDFCDRSCRSAESRALAVESARRTFSRFEECFNLAMANDIGEPEEMGRQHQWRSC